MPIIGKSQLMDKYKVGCLKTWGKMLEPISGKLRKNCKIYYPREIRMIREWLEYGRVVD